MKNQRRVLLLEFNELSPDLMNRFMAEGHLPNFKRFHDESHVFITEATERGWELNPWVQWVTVHSGLDYRAHGIIELDEGDKLKAKRIWDIVSEAGLKVCVCGSMNVAYQTPPNGVIMPDPWSTKVAPHPSSLMPFFRFVQKQVMGHTQNQTGLSAADYAAFLRFMVTHGLSFSTAAAVVMQLLSEPFGERRWKRAALLDRLQFDVFRWYYRRIRPHFASFFANSTAHYQHFYWREMQPELFKVKPTEQKRAAYERAILYGYQKMDELVARFLKLVEPDTIVVFATALSQQPCLIYEDQGGKVMYRPRTFEKLMCFAQVTEPHTVAPVMAEVFNVHLESETDAARVEEKLRTLRVAGQPAMHVQRKGTVLNAKCQVHTSLPADTVLSREGDAQTVPFFELFYQMEDLKSGMHHPDGMLWIRLPEKRSAVHESKVPLASVAPTILRLLSLPCPPHMTAPPLAV